MAATEDGRCPLSSAKRLSSAFGQNIFRFSVLRFATKQVRRAAVLHDERGAAEILDIRQGLVEDLGLRDQLFDVHVEGIRGSRAPPSPAGSR